MPRLAKTSQIYFFKHHSYYSTNTQVKSEAGTNEIVIPYRIERGPTDILKALASTVSKDHTAAHYKYEDDPYFIPSSNITKRAFALSKESGRKAARYFLENYPELFKCNKSVPHIKAFDPPVVYTEENVTSAKELQDCIREHNVDQSMNVYNILKKKGITVSQDTKQDLLQLLCFFNSKQPPPDEYYEERFYSRIVKRSEKWNAKGMAEQLFKEMERDSHAFSTMIAGASKFNDAVRATSLLAEMKEKGLSATIEAYNGLLSVVNFLKEDSELRWEYAVHFLSMMNSEGLKPNLYTMNALLELLSENARWRRSFQHSLNVLAEMRKLKIEPSLGTYYYLLTTFCSHNVSKANILYEIMNHLEGKEFEIQHPADVLFFSTAMELCDKGTMDKDLGHRIHNLLELKNNCKLLGNSFSESMYFKFYFRLLCKWEEIDKLMEIYEKYVPNSYTPEPSITLAVIEAIHLNGDYKHLPKICSDVLFFEQTERENILTLLMDAAACMKHEEKTQTDLVNMVWNILMKLDSRSQARRLPFDWTGALLGNFLKTFLNGNDMEKSWTVLKKLKDEENNIIGFPDADCLLKFCELNLEKEDYSKVLYCIKYAVNTNHPNFREDVEKLANEMFDQGKLLEKQRTQVNAILLNASSLEIDTDSDSSSSESSSDDSSSDEEEEDNNDKPSV
ncbi:protein PTCD3 homolog, mitochondrial [Nephila pilipes]|uniref:Small ribosomal subunit protein mS39 n=1 Tax=Nephila pilipes TaxID=299642 RepID=A0A8X6NSS0_NEPPI|nr:protein PTCD3 homolog, mitochondrial [Nephila pilipes]